jgi:hypothetical protein
MKKVRTMGEAYRVFEYLGMKNVTKEWQRNKGTEVWELPFKTMYYNGAAEINRFTIYRNGYVRKMVVYGENNASKSCYQLNRVRKEAEYFKDYKWNDVECTHEWTGKYRKRYANKRIMIDTHQDRVVYLCNYILKNYYRSNKMNLVGEYTMKRVAEVHGEWWKANRNNYQLPFTDEGKRYDDELCVNDIKVIINGHRYNLS